MHIAVLLLNLYVKQHKKRIKDIKPTTLIKDFNFLANICYTS